MPDILAPSSKDSQGPKTLSSLINLHDTIKFGNTQTITKLATAKVKDELQVMTNNEKQLKLTDPDIEHDKLLEGKQEELDGLNKALNQCRQLNKFGEAKWQLFASSSTKGMPKLPATMTCVMHCATPSTSQPTGNGVNAEELKMGGHHQGP